MKTRVAFHRLFELLHELSGTALYTVMATEQSDVKDYIVIVRGFASVVALTEDFVKMEHQIRSSLQQI